MLNFKRIFSVYLLFLLLDLQAFETKTEAWLQYVPYRYDLVISVEGKAIQQLKDKNEKSINAEVDKATELVSQLKSIALKDLKSIHVAVNTKSTAKLTENPQGREAIVLFELNRNIPLERVLVELKKNKPELKLELREEGGRNIYSITREGELTIFVTQLQPNVFVVCTDSSMRQVLQLPKHPSLLQRKDFKLPVLQGVRLSYRPVVGSAVQLGEEAAKKLALQSVEEKLLGSCREFDFTLAYVSQSLKIRAKIVLDDEDLIKDLEQELANGLTQIGELNAAAKILAAKVSSQLIGKRLKLSLDVDKAFYEQKEADFKALAEKFMLPLK